MNVTTSCDIQCAFLNHVLPEEQPLLPGCACSWEPSPCPGRDDPVPAAAPRCSGWGRCRLSWLHPCCFWSVLGAAPCSGSGWRRTCGWHGGSWWGQPPARWGCGSAPGAPSGNPRWQSWFWQGTKQGRGFSVLPGCPETCNIFARWNPPVEYPKEKPTPHICQLCQPTSFYSPEFLQILIEMHQETTFF